MIRLTNCASTPGSAAGAEACPRPVDPTETACAGGADEPDRHRAQEGEAGEPAARPTRWGAAGISRMIGTKRSSLEPRLGAAGAVACGGLPPREPGLDHRSPPRRRRRCRSPAGRTTTYGELRDQVAGLRGGLAGLGLEPGDRVGIVAANNWYFVVSYLAVLGAGCRGRAAQPDEPGAGGAARAGRHRRPAVIAGPRGQADGRRARPRRPPRPRARDRQRGRRPRRGRPRPRRPPRRRPGAGRRPGRRRPRRADVHQRHRRLAEGRHAHPRQPAGQPRAVPGPPGTPADGRRRGARRAAALPHLRAQRRARASRSPPAPRCCSSSASTRSRRSSRSRDHGVTVISGAPTMWAAWAALPGAPPTPSPPCASPPRRRQARPRGRRCHPRPLRAATSPRATASPRPRPSSPRAIGIEAPAGQHRRAPPRPRRCAWSTPTAGRPRRRRRRALGARAQRLHRLLERPRGHPDRPHRRRLAPHRRHRRGRRRRLPLPGRPGQGPDHRVGLQRVPGRGRGGARRAPGGRRRRPWSACPTRTPARP